MKPSDKIIIIIKFIKKIYKILVAYIYCYLLVINQSIKINQKIYIYFYTYFYYSNIDDIQKGIYD